MAAVWALGAEAVVLVEEVSQAEALAEAAWVDGKVKPAKGWHFNPVGSKALTRLQKTL